MSSLLVKNIDVSLLREINYAASKAELTQRDWVIKILTEATNGNRKFTKRASRSSGQPEYPDPPQVVPLEKHLTGSTAQVEHPICNQEDAGSNPAGGSIKSETIPDEKCWCGAPVVEVRDPNSGVRKWKCTEKGHFSTPKQKPHDVKTCTIQGCGTCRIIGVKDPTRGL
jgi:hypothetical protein